MKKLLINMLIFAMLLCCVSGCGNEEKHIYDNAQTVEAYNDDNTSTSVLIKADESDCTEEALADCYYNYFKTGEFDYCVIVYNDSDPLEGVFISDCLVEKGALLTDKGNDVYLLAGNADDAVFYTPTPDSETLTVIDN